MGREFVTEPVGNLINSTGDKIGKAGLLVSAAVPPVGESMLIIGAIMEVSGSGIVGLDQYLSEGAMSDEALVNLVVDVSFEIVPKPFENALDKSGVKKELKETAKFQLRAVTETLKDQTESINKQYFFDPFKK
jgi:hypothetical protein